MSLETGRRRAGIDLDARAVYDEDHRQTRRRQDEGVSTRWKGKQNESRPRHDARDF